MEMLSAPDRARIEATIADIEQRTAAEMVVVVLGRSGDYAEIKFGCALALALAAGGVGHLCLPALSTGWLLWLQLGVALAVFAALSVPAILRAVTPRSMFSRSVEQRAQLAFLEHALFETRDRTGVLILLSLLERRVAILGDNGIHARVQPEGWQTHVERIVHAIHRRRTADGLCETLRALGDMLSIALPQRADDVDELSNEVRQRPR